MNDIALIGLDLGKHSFHIHAQDRHGHMVTRKKFNRTQLIRYLANVPVCKVVMESCAGAHWMARRLQVLGHQVKLI